MSGKNFTFSTSLPWSDQRLYKNKNKLKRLKKEYRNTRTPKFTFISIPLSLLETPNNANKNNTQNTATSKGYSDVGNNLLSRDF